MRATAALVALCACGTPYAQRHRVGSGESVATIAARYGVPDRELRSFNRLRPEDEVRPGDILFVPGARPPDPAVVRSPGVPAAPPTPAPVERPPPVASAPVPAPAPNAPRSSAVTLAWPLEGALLRGFGVGPAGESRGIDLAAAPGTPVQAAAAGTVSYAGTPRRPYAPMVILRHPGELFTVYGNLGQVTVQEGQDVRSGEALGASGPAAGALPAHLHFEVRRGGAPLDPVLFLPPR